LKNRIRTLAALLAAPALLEAQAVDWPQFRGPKRDGVSADAGLLKEWPAEGPKVAWQAKGIGGGYASVSIAGGRIYTLGNGRGVTSVHALEAATGKLLWSAEVGKAGGSLGSTPTVDGERLYAVGQEGDFVCVETATGRVAWRKSFFTDFGGKYGGWKYTESPLVDGDHVVCTPGGRDSIVALDKKNGEVAWTCALPSGEAAGYSSIVVSEAGGIRHYVQLLADSLVGVEAKTGKLLWRYGEARGRFAGNTANIPTPIVKDDLVFCAAGYGRGAALLRLVPQDGGLKAEEVYFARELTNKHGGVILVGDHVYGDRDDRGTPFCADFKTGKIVEGWKPRPETAGKGSVSVTAADGHVYFRYESGHVALVAADPAGYREKSSFQVAKRGGQSWAHPVVSGGKLYLRENDALWCYELKP
jgi:outer membrane protein assembly factor BamB